MTTAIKTLALSSFETELAVEGHGPPLLMIQGLGTDRRAWQPAVDRLSGHVRCHTYDNRGVGAAAGADLDMTIEDLAEDAAEIIEAIGGGPMHVCGVSLGGGIAMRLAARYPDLVRSLALHATTHRPDARLLAVLDYRVRLVDAGMSAELLGPFVSLFAWSPSEMHLNRLPEGAADMSKVSDVNYRAYLQAAIDQDMPDEELNGIASPTLIVGGAQDILTPLADSRALHAAIPGARMLAIEGGGHAYYAEDPDLFASIQSGWVLRHA